VKKYELIEIIELTEEEEQLLIRCVQQGYLEYRDSRTPTLTEFREQGLSQGEDWYLRRNEGGTYLQAESLYEKGLIEDYTDAWHLSFQISEKGKKIFNLFNK
jgi:hypothetical protein